MTGGAVLFCGYMGGIDVFTRGPDAGLVWSVAFFLGLVVGVCGVAVGCSGEDDPHPHW